ncbi:MAG: hypothetical protein U9N76_06975 [Candidatus Marinimicrobia bacterium]|nr:hypothetical protein [Candidatus Neomarinimicrobiota bacterium]
MTINILNRKKIKRFLYVCMIIIFLISNIFAKDKIFFNKNTPYLDDVYFVLKSKNFVLTQDSVNADYFGEISGISKSDSIQYQIVIKNDYEEKIIGSFSKEQLSKSFVKSEVKRFTFFSFLLNTFVIVLYFLRST